MSVSKWAYTPEKCEGDFCFGDCDRCPKAYSGLEEMSLDKAIPASDCAYPNCEECDKYHGHYCTVPMVINKQIYRLTDERIQMLEQRVLDVESLVYDKILGLDK